LYQVGNYIGMRPPVDSSDLGSLSTRPATALGGINTALHYAGHYRRIRSVRVIVTVQMPFPSLIS
jgi:hypothetical protein